MGCCKTALREWSSHRHQADRVHPIRMQLAELEQRLHQRNNAERQLKNLTNIMVNRWSLMIC